MLAGKDGVEPAIERVSREGRDPYNQSVPKADLIPHVPPQPSSLRHAIVGPEGSRDRHLGVSQHPSLGSCQNRGDILAELRTAEPSRGAATQAAPVVQWTRRSPGVSVGAAAASV